MATSEQELLHPERYLGCIHLVPLPSIIHTGLNAVLGSKEQHVRNLGHSTVHLFGCADSITAYSLTDNSQLTRQIYQSILGFCYVVLITGSTLDLGPNGNFGVLLVLACLMSISTVWSSVQRIGARQMASASWGLNKVVADYMCGERTMGELPHHYDPASMTGYHYLVDWPIGQMPSEDRRIDIEKVWKSNLVSPDLKDACLSFSLCHLLRRRFFGFKSGESLLPKTHDFVFKGLLGKKQQQISDEAGTVATDAVVDYEWPFKVIEDELACMYDFFFTSYAAIYYGIPGRYTVTLFSATLTVVAAFMMARGLLRAPHANANANGWSVIMDTTATDVGITLLKLGCIAFLQLAQMLHYGTTIWGRVSVACDAVRGGGCCCITPILFKIGVLVSSCWHHGEEKLGQYSLLESVASHLFNKSITKRLADRLHRARPKLLVRGLYLLFRPGNLHPSRRALLVPRPRVVRNPGKPKALPVAVKKALVKSLERTQGKLTNGESSLSSNGADNLLWACSQRLGTGTTSCSSQEDESQVGVILTWHIATCHCDQEVTGEQEQFKEHHEVATTLSKYCAYLIVSAPNLLPGHHYETRLALEEVAEEAIRHQSTAGTPQQEDATIYQNGLALGKQLNNMEAARCWKVLADFWAEMLLYLAPSENVEEHVECLAKGGEFITKLWALLTHAGILERGQRDIENPGDGSSHSSTTTSQAAKPVSTCAKDQPATTENNHTVKPGTMVRQQANLVQKVEGTSNACAAPSGIEETEQ